MLKAGGYKISRTSKGKVSGGKQDEDRECVGVCTREKNQHGERAILGGETREKKKKSKEETKQTGDGGSARRRTTAVDCPEGHVEKTELLV